MRVYALNPPFTPKYSRESRSPAATKGGAVYYPMWLAYAAGVLEKEGHTVYLQDAVADQSTKEDVIRKAKQFKTEMVMVDTSTASIYNDVEVAMGIKEVTGAKILMVGTFPSALPKETLEMNKEIDAAAVHEFDYIARDFAAEIEKKDCDLSNVRGLAYRDKEGNMKQNTAMPLIKNLDEIPFVTEMYKKFLDIYDYFYPANLYPEVMIAGSRGCPYRCIYCVWPQVLNGHEYRARSNRNLLDEFEYVSNEFPDLYKRGEIFLEDDTFTVFKNRVHEFADMKKQRKLDITWSTNARADVPLETLQKMKGANCRLVCVGIESGNQKILNNIRKGTQIPKIRQFFADTKKVGILVHGCFMMGNKGDTKETLQETVEFAKELEPDSAQFFPIMVYPGTEAYEWARKNNYLQSNNYRDWVDEQGLHNTIVSTEHVTAEELVETCNRARKEFYLRPKYIAKKFGQTVSSPKEARRILKASGTFYRFLLGS